jgi:hypothetical protein
MACSAIGASQGGALTQLIALGAADKYLSQNPSITFWRFRYNRYTNFAMEAIEQPFNTQVMFGSDTQLTFNRTGDLLFWTYVVVDLPGIYACDNSSLSAQCKMNSGNFPQVMFQQKYPGLAQENFCDPCGDEPPLAGATADDSDCCGYPENVRAPWAHYTNAVGQWLVRRSSLVIGGQVIDTLYSDYLYMWEELSGKPGKRLREMVGKETCLHNLIEDSARDRRLYIPLPFWFTQTTGNALPVVSLQFHGIQLHVAFAELSTCIQTSCKPNVDAGGAIIGSTPLIVLKTRNNTPLVEQDLRSLIESTYVYLDIDERDRFATGSFEQLITQVQAYQICTRSSQVRLSLNFNHPIIELMWAIRRNCQSSANNWFCYSGKNCDDPIKIVSLKLNNLPRFAPKEGRYFRLVQPYQFHTNIPDNFVYCYSFAIHPEEAQPSGSCNFSRIDNIELTFDMQDGIDQPNPGLPSQPGSCNVPQNTGDFTALVFGRNWNVLRFREGLGGLAFSN